LRTYTLLAIAAVATGLLVGIVIASSGGDGDKSESQSVPELRPPGGSVGDGEDTTTTDTTTTDTTTTETQTGTTPTQTPPSGGTEAPPADTEGNDTPPPAGSPAERFEDFCAQNPGAC
jgi:hypothetical protein